MHLSPERPELAPLLSCAAVPNLYDLMVMLDPDAPEERRTEILGNVESMIASGGGTVVGHHDWGVRRIAFEIDHRPEAAYHLYQFENESNETLERLNHNLRIADGVLRFRIIKVKPGTPPPPEPRQEPPRAPRERPQETRVAARAAADAEQPAGEEAAAAEQPPAAETVVAEAPPPEPAAEPEPDPLPPPAE